MFSMFLIIDTMAQKYGMLPFEVLSRANTGDLQVHIAVETYRDQQRNPDRDLNNDYTQEELLEMWNKRKGSKFGKDTSNSR